MKKEKKEFEEKLKNIFNQDKTVYQFWGRIGRWYADEYLLKGQRVVFYPIQENNTLGITFFENQKACFEENNIEENIEEKRMEIHLLITRTVDSISMKESSIEMI